IRRAPHSPDRGEQSSMSSQSRRQKTSRRVKNIRLSIWACALGGIALAGASGWIERSRKTDLADPRAGVSSKLREERAIGSFGDLESAPFHFRDATEELGV